MFLIALTRHPIATDRLLAAQEQLQVDVTTVDGFVATAVTDGRWSTYNHSGDGFSASEHTVDGRAHDVDALVAVRATYNGSNRRLELDHRMISGKNLYYATNDQGEFFCSTHIALLKGAGVPLSEAPDRLAEFFAFRFIFPPQTLFNGVLQLARGSALTIESTEQGFVVGTSIPYLPPSNDQPVRPNDADRTQAADSTLACIVNAIERLAPIHGDLSVLLSGGVDSSLLFREVQRQFGLSESFSAGFPFAESPNLEREYAESAGLAFGSEHKYFEPSTNEYLAGVVSAIAATEQPLHHLQTVLLFLLFERGLTADAQVIVCGEGADNLFGLRLHRWLQAGEAHPTLFGLASTAPGAFVARLASRLSGRGGTLATVVSANVNAGAMEDPNHICWLDGCFGDIDWIERRFGVDRRDVVANGAAMLQTMSDRSTADALSYTTMMGDTQITQGLWTKAAEASGHSVYYPFNDREISDLAFSVPWALKATPPKAVLRDAGRQMGVPDFILTRPKMGFGVDSSQWAPRGAALDPLVALASKVYDEQEIRQMQVTDPETATAFWNMINHAIWRRLWIDLEPVEALLGELDEALMRSESGRS